MNERRKKELLIYHIEEAYNLLGESNDIFPWTSFLWNTVSLKAVLYRAYLILTA